MELRRFVFRKSDGRSYIQFHSEPGLKKLDQQVPHLLDEGLLRPASYQEPSIRYNLMRDEWVAISASRNQRPFLPPTDYCPLCPATAYLTNAAGEICKTDVPLMSRPYEWAVLENMFPGLGHGNQTGHCEVILYTADHHSALSQTPSHHIRGLIEVWVDRSQEVGRKEDVKFVYIFENKGVEVGVTLHHPHGQLYGMNHIPPFIARELDAARKHFHTHGRCLICELAEQEGQSARVVAQTPNLVAYVPEAARYPYEVHITTRTHRPRIEDLTQAERSELAVLLKVVLTKYNLLMNMEFPYILAHHQVPHKADQMESDLTRLEQCYHWHLEFYPPYRSPGKLKYLAGVESGTGLFINDTIPEDKARELRELPTEFEHLLFPKKVDSKNER